MTDEPKIMKRPGWDWDVRYIEEHDEGPDTVETMVIFGCVTVEDAMRDARSSFEDEFMPAFISVQRQDMTGQ